MSNRMKQLSGVWVEGVLRVTHSTRTFLFQMMEEPCDCARSGNYKCCNKLFTLRYVL